MTAALLEDLQSTGKKPRSWQPPLHVRRLTDWNQRPGVVYFLRHLETGHIKIGFTIGDPRRRCRAVTSTVGSVEWIGYFRARASAEILAHRRFHNLRVGHEWFKPSPELIAWTRKRSPGFAESEALEHLFGLSMLIKVKGMTGQSHKARLRFHSRMVDVDYFDFTKWLSFYRLPSEHLLEEVRRVLRSFHLQHLEEAA